MTTSTKNKKTDIDIAKEALEQAQNALLERRQALTDAVAHLDDIKRSWAAGRVGEYSAKDKSEAEAEVELWKTVLPAAERAVVNAERKLKSLSPLLAEAVAFALGDAIYGVPAKAVTVAPIKGAEVPDVHVRESVLHSYVGEGYGANVRPDGSGRIKGSVEVIVTGPDWMEKPDSSIVVTALLSGGIGLPTGNFGHGFGKRGDGVFVMSVPIREAMPLVPVIAKPGGHNINYLLGSNVIDLALRGEADGYGRSKVVDATIDSDGIQRLVVDSSIAFRGIGTVRVDVLARQAHDYLTRSFRVGKGFRWLGTIEDMSLSESNTTVVGHGREWPGRAVTARVTFVSKASQ